jgi:hypothetical protein
MGPMQESVTVCHKAHSFNVTTPTSLVVCHEGPDL